MNAESSPNLPYNPDVLRWAREFAQIPIHEAAKKVGTSPENVEAGRRRFCSYGSSRAASGEGL